MCELFAEHLKAFYAGKQPHKADFNVTHKLLNYVAWPPLTCFNRKKGERERKQWLLT